MEYVLNPLFWNISLIVILISVLICIKSIWMSLGCIMCTDWGLLDTALKHNSNPCSVGGSEAMQRQQWDYVWTQLVSALYFICFYLILFKKEKNPSSQYTKYLKKVCAKACTVSNLILTKYRIKVMLRESNKLNLFDKLQFVAIWWENGGLTLNWTRFATTHIILNTINDLDSSHSTFLLILLHQSSNMQ